MSNDKTGISHRDLMVEKLRDRPRFAAEYLKAALEYTDEPEVLLIALRQIAEARGGLAKIAKREERAKAPVSNRNDGIETEN